MAVCRAQPCGGELGECVVKADEWAWSSCRAHVCKGPTPSRLDSGPSVGPLGGGRPRRHEFGSVVRRTGYVPKAQHKSFSTLQECLRANGGST